MNVLIKHAIRKKNTGSGNYLIRQARDNHLLWTVVIIDIAILLIVASPARAAE